MVKICILSLRIVIINKRHEYDLFIGQTVPAYQTGVLADLKCQTKYISEIPKLPADAVKQGRNGLNPHCLYLHFKHTGLFDLVKMYLFAPNWQTISNICMILENKRRGTSHLLHVFSMSKILDNSGDDFIHFIYPLWYSFLYQDYKYSTLIEAVLHSVMSLGVPWFIFSRHYNEQAVSLWFLTNIRTKRLLF